MRSYKQYCAIAKALDVVGDRWNMLIVRELLLQGACRYTDLHNGLPGIATNLLAERLRDLEREGLVAREEAPPPIATTLFRLTPRGQELEPILVELGRWGAPLMTEPDEQDAYRGYWLVSSSVSPFVSDRAPDEPPVTIELRTGEEAITVETREGKVHTQAGAADKPDLILTGPPELLVGVLTSQLNLTTARARGLQTRGNAKVLRRLRPEPAEAETAVRASLPARS
jgi:DNA-binding HxlR family transcriptional regulator